MIKANIGYTKIPNPNKVSTSQEILTVFLGHPINSAIPPQTPSNTLSLDLVSLLFPIPISNNKF